MGLGQLARIALFKKDAQRNPDYYKPVKHALGRLNETLGIAAPKPLPSEDVWRNLPSIMDLSYEKANQVLFIVFKQVREYRRFKSYTAWFVNHWNNKAREYQPLKAHSTLVLNEEEQDMLKEMVMWICETYGSKRDTPGWCKYNLGIIQIRIICRYAAQLVSNYSPRFKAYYESIYEPENVASQKRHAIFWKMICKEHDWPFC